MTLDINFVRNQFPGLKSEWTFLDNAGGSQILKGVVDNINDFYFTKFVQLGASYEVSQNASTALQKSRDNIATLFNAAKSDEILFGSSTTILLQHLSKAMASQFQAGDEIIISITEHEANVAPWVALEEKGVIIKFWPMNNETYELELDELDKIMSEKTKLVCFTHASNILGTVNPVKEITSFVHSRGAKVCVDAVAYAPHRAIDVQNWNVDFYVLSLYKVYGPHLATLYCRYDHMLELDNIYHFFYGKQDIPIKMEPGNVNYELAYGSIAIIDYLEELGSQAGNTGSRREKLVAAYDDISKHEALIAERLLEYLRKRNDCTIFGIKDGDDSRRVPVISFTIKGKDPEQVTLAMDKHKIAMRFGDFYARRLTDSLDITKDKSVLRVSMTHYNTLEEVDALIAALDDVLSS